FSTTEPQGLERRRAGGGGVSLLQQEQTAARRRAEPHDETASLALHDQGFASGEDVTGAVDGRPLESDPALESIRQAFRPFGSMAEVGRQPLTRQPRGRPDPVVRSQEYDPPSDLLQPLQAHRDLPLLLRIRLGVPRSLYDV